MNECNEDPNADTKADEGLNRKRALRGVGTNTNEDENPKHKRESTLGITIGKLEHRTGIHNGGHPGTGI